MAQHSGFLVVFVAMGLSCPGLSAAESPPGDRSLPINQVYPAGAFYHNGKGGRVLDVTKPPFDAKGDGVTDDTDALIAAMRFVRDHYERIQGEGYSYCDQQRTQNWTLYLPDGEYLVNDTICQGWPAQAMNILKGWSHVQSVQVESLEHEAELNANGKRQVYVRSYARAKDMLFPSPAAQNTDIWRLYRNTRPQGATKEVFVSDSSYFGAGGQEGQHALENVRAWTRMVNNEHLPGAQYAFRRSDAWIFGFKSEGPVRWLFGAQDRSRLDVLGGYFLNWSPQKDPVITAKNSSVSVVCVMRNCAGIILSDETNGTVTTVPGTQCPRLAEQDGTAVVAGSGISPGDE